jgi:hypothetical protein
VVVRPKGKTRSRDVVVVNPLGGALHHYTERLVQTLRAADVHTTSIDFLEPSRSGGSRAAWVWQYLTALVSASRRRQRGAQVLVTWPVLGHLDRILVSMLSGDRRATIVLHDPRPLVKAVGYGRTAVAASQLFAPRTSILVHSDLALEDVEAQGLDAVNLPHPIGVSETPRVKPSSPLLRVLGQWKPDRDTALLAALVPLLPGVRLEIVGRGWPAVTGWTVRDAFVSEEELDSLVSTSSAVLIPYQRYYQSGIAARALEAAVPVIGRKKELAPMTGSRYPFLVDDPQSAKDWAEVVKTALLSETDQLEKTRDATRARAEQAWTEWSER